MKNSLIWRLLRKCCTPCTTSETNKKVVALLYCIKPFWVESINPSSIQIPNNVWPKQIIQIVHKLFKSQTKITIKSNWLLCINHNETENGSIIRKYKHDTNENKSKEKNKKTKNKNENEKQIEMRKCFMKIITWRNFWICSQMYSF